jgi:hypothetical protein
MSPFNAAEHLATARRALEGRHCSVASLAFAFASIGSDADRNIDAHQSELSASTREEWVRKPRRTNEAHPSSALSANAKSPKSAGEIIPSSANISKLTSLRQ